MGEGGINSINRYKHTYLNCSKANADNLFDLKWRKPVLDVSSAVQWWDGAGLMNDNDDALYICIRLYYSICCSVWAQPRMLSSSIFVLWETFRTSQISSQTSQLTVEYYRRPITQPPPALLPRAEGEWAVSHRGSWWGGGSSTHRRLFSKITETLIPSTYSVLVSITTKPM